MGTSRSNEHYYHGHTKSNLKFRVLQELYKCLRYFEKGSFKGGCIRFGSTCFSTYETAIDFTRRNSLQKILNFSRVVLCNTQNNSGDRQKIINFIESTTLQLGEGDLRYRNAVERKFYTAVEKIVLDLIINQPSDNFELNFTEFTDCQIECIYKLANYFNKFSTQYLSPEIGTIKFNVTVTAMEELLKPNISHLALVPLFTTYKSEREENSFLRKYGLISKNRNADTLVGTLSEIIKNLETSESKIIPMEKRESRILS
jgi:hypothetical protein